MADRRIVTTETLTGQQVAAVMSLVDSVTDADGVRPLDEHVLLHLRYGGEAPSRNLLLYSGAELAGYAHLDPTDPVEGPSAELTVAPAHRGRGHARALTRELLDTSPRSSLRLWAHGNHPAAARLAAAMGFQRVRSLWQLRRSLETALPEPQLPADVQVRTFVPGRDEQAWVELNARAFSDHPEQGTWTVDELRLREREPWFDPAGFFLAERDGQLLGFHWTKVHGGDGTVDGGADDSAHDVRDGGGEGHGHEPLGEVYVVGVDPAGRGLGLGRALTLVGLRHLQERGLTQAMLYVDESNRAAIGLYESLGFTHWDTDVMFRYTPVTDR